MNCADMDDTLDARAAGLLEAPREQELTEHVDSCAACGARAQRLARLEDALRRRSDLQAQAALRVPQLRARVQAGLLTQGAARPARESRGKLLLVAASLTVCLLLLKFIVSPPEPGRNPAGPRVPEAPPQTEPPKQDRDDVATLVARLADDQPEARSEALRKLVALGPSILPRLRAWPRLEGADARGLLADAIRRLEESETIPPFVGITLEADRKPARDVLLEIGAKAGIPKEQFTFMNSGGDAVSVSLKDATPLQAIDDVCRKAFSMSYRRDTALPHRGLLFLQAPFEERPTTYVRHYRVRAASVDVPAIREKGAVPVVRLEVSWSPQIQPFSMTRIQDLVVTDDQGRVLNEGMLRMGGPQFFVTDFTREHTDFAMFRFPQEGTRSLSARGYVEFRYPRERETLVFEAPGEGQGRTFTLDGMTLTLKNFKQKDRDILIEFETIDKPDPLTFGRLSRTDVEAVTASGERLSAGYNCSVESRGSTSLWHFRMKSSKAEAIKEIRVGHVKSFCTDRADFEIKGIPYPK